MTARIFICLHRTNKNIVFQLSIELSAADEKTPVKINENVIKSYEKATKVERPHPANEIRWLRWMSSVASTICSLRTHKEECEAYFLGLTDFGFPN